MPLNYAIFYIFGGKPSTTCQVSTIFSFSMRYILTPLTLMILSVIHLLSIVAQGVPGNSNGITGEEREGPPPCSDGSGCCLIWIATVLTRTQIGRVPVPPTMLGMRLLKVVMCSAVSRRSPTKIATSVVFGPIKFHSRPGSRVWISRSSQPSHLDPRKRQMRSTIIMNRFSYFIK